MLRLIEEVQIFLLSNPDKDRALTEPNVISYTLIKLTKNRGMYTKGIEKWQKRPPQNRRKWAELLAHMVEEYGGHITKKGSNTMGLEG